MIRVLIRVRDTSTPTWCDRPVEGPACRPTLIPCRSTINSRSLRRGLDDCHVVAFHVAALSKTLPKSAHDPSTVTPDEQLAYPAPVGRTRPVAPWLAIGKVPAAEENFAMKANSTAGSHGRNGCRE
jgi:hypothetical protein